MSPSAPGAGWAQVRAPSPRKVVEAALVKPTQAPDQARRPLFSSSWSQEPITEDCLFPHLGSIFYIIPLNSAIDTCTSAYEVSLYSLLGPSIFLLCLCQSFQKFLYMQVGRRVHKVWLALCTDSSSPHTHGPHQLWQDPASHGISLGHPSDHLWFPPGEHTVASHMCYTDTVTMKSLVNGCV